MAHVQPVQQHLPLAVLVVQLLNGQLDALEPLLDVLAHGGGVPGGDDLMDLLEGDSQQAELADDEQRQDLILGVIAVVALVLAVFRHQEADLIVVAQGFDGHTAQCGDFSDGIIAFAVRHQSWLPSASRRDLLWYTV